MNSNTHPNTQVTTPSEREITMTRVFDAPRELVWEAWTNPKHIPNWMLGPEGWTLPVCETDFRVGGTWHFVWRKDDGEEMEMHGIYKEIAAPEKLVSTENWGGDWPESLQTLTLTEANGKTTLTHTILFVSQEARDNAMKTGMADGASTTFDKLAEYLLTLK